MTMLHTRFQLDKVSVWCESVGTGARGCEWLDGIVNTWMPRSVHSLFHRGHCAASAGLR